MIRYFDTGLEPEVVQDHSFDRPHQYGSIIKIARCLICGLEIIYNRNQEIWIVVPKINMLLGMVLDHY